MLGIFFNESRVYNNFLCFICPRRLKDDVASSGKLLHRITTSSLKTRRRQIDLRPRFQELNQTNLMQKLSITSPNQSHSEEVLWTP